MANKLLGVARVKALLETLEQDHKERLRKIERDFPSHAEVEQMAERNLGIDTLRTKLNEVIAEAQTVADRVSELTGRNLEVREIRSGYKTDLPSRLSQEIDRLNVPYLKAVENEKTLYQRQRRHLWMCTSIEEAQKIIMGEL